MATERIQIIVSEKGSVTVKKNIDSIGKSGQTAASGIDMLKGALAAYISLQGVSALTGLADAGTQLTNSLKVAGLAGEQLVASQQKIIDVAKSNGQNVNDLAAVYQKLLITQNQLGASGETIDHVFTGIAASMKLSSAGTAAQAGSLQQLSQLLGGTRVQAQEFNSLIDGAYPLLQAVAAGSDRWGGSVAKLTQDVKAMNVSTKEFFDALNKGVDINIQLAQSFNFTIGQALQNFRTNLVAAVLDLNNATNVFGLLANAINFAGEHLGLMAALISPLIAALTILAVQTIGGMVIGALTGMVATLVSVATVLVTTVIPAVVSFTAAIITNPILAAGAAVAIAGIVLFRSNLEALGNTIVDTAAKVAGLDKFGNFSNGEFNINVKGQEFAGAASSAISNSSKSGAGLFQKAIQDGAANGAKTLADAQAAGVARYEALNGKTVQALGDTMVDGGKYIYNQVTGATTKGAGDLGKAVDDGGKSAGETISDHMVSAGQQVGATVYDSLESAFASLAPLIDVFTQASLRFMVENNKIRAETAKDNADARATLAGIDSHRPNGGGGYGGGSGGSAAPSQYVSEGRTLGPTSAPSGLGVTTTETSSQVTVINVTDPSELIAVNASKTGQKSIINVLKSNREEIQKILGVG